LDPKEPRSRSPSLLDADAHEAPEPSSSERILSGLQGNAPRPVRSGRPRRWLWPSVLLLVGLAAVLMLVFGGAFDDPGTAAPMHATAPADTVPADEGAAQDSPMTSPEGQGSDDAADAAQGVAVILPGEAAPAVAATAAAPALASSSSKDAVALSEIFTPPSERKRVAARRPVARRAGNSGDSDVALLTALIQHVEVGDSAARKRLERIPHVQKPADPADSIEAHMQACPAANTEAGLRCRQRLCAGHSGESTACPAASPNGA
jgi:hypothetical protein